MARPSKEQRLAEIHAEAREEFNRVQQVMRPERQQCVNDRRFYSIPGAMWEDQLGKQYENKPRLEVNKVHLSVIRIFNEYRNNRISVDFVTKDGSDNDGLADVCDGLYRADEQDSCAQEAYDNAFEEAVGGGFGAWRLRACYENEYDEDDDKQRIRMEPIFDADTSVYFDLDAKRQDKSDAKKCWVVYSMTMSAFKAEYGEDPATWPKDTNSTYFDWFTPDVVYIAEYYQVEETKQTVRIYKTLDGETIKIMDEDLDDDEEPPIGAIEVGRKTVRKKRVHKYIMSGANILEDCGYITGCHIPIIPVYGKRWFVDNVERCMGQVRIAKDSQRLKNMQISMLALISASFGLEKPIFTPDQMAGNELMWQEDNIKNYPYLLINPVEDAEGNVMPSGPVAYTRAPNVPPAMAALLQITEQDMAEMLGNNQQAEKMVSNISGKAVEMIQTRLDMQSFIYISNMSKAMQRCGEVWLSMARELYHEKGRKMKSVGEMGNIESVELGKETINKSGQLASDSDLSKANLDVAVDVGPSFMSRRNATVTALTGVLQMTTDPQDAKILQALIMMNMDGEGLTEVREYKRKELVALGVLPPNEEEQAAMAEQEQNQEPNPQDAYMLAEAEKSKALAIKAEADTEYTLAKTQGEQANTAKTIKELGEPSAPKIG